MRCPRILWVACALLAQLATGITCLAAPSVTPYYPTFHTDETITIQFSGGPGGAKDWIGIFPSDASLEDAPAAELWSYVDGTQNGVSGVGDGSVTLFGGLPLAGTWTVYLLVDDSYTAIASNQVIVLDRTQPILRVNQRSYRAHTTVYVSYSGGPGNAKDWIGIYRAGQTPGSDAPVLRVYTDGTLTGDTGMADGNVSFPAGLRETGFYDAHLFRNDSNEILSSDTFEVTPGNEIPPVLGPITPLHGSSNVPPFLEFSAVFTNGTSLIVPGSVTLTLDGTVVPATVTNDATRVVVRYTDPNLPPSGPHTWELAAQDDATPPNRFQATSTVIVGPYTNLQLPEPIHFLDFDSVPEGSLPPGWTQESYTIPMLSAVDFQSLASAAYSRWTSVRADRFTNLFSIYGDPANQVDDYKRVLSVNLFNVVDGKVLNEPLPRGNFLFSNSGFQSRTSSQVFYLYTSDFDLTGHTGVHLGFKSVWEQNEDSMAAIEYSIDGGVSWLPVAYYLDPFDIVMTPGGGSVNAVATFTQRHDDIARYFDDTGAEVGGTFGAFIAAPVSSALGPYIMARIDEDPIGSKRIEFFPVPQADNQRLVRFRFAHAGTDSWYFGIDDFGLYSVGNGTGGAPRLGVTRAPNGIVLNWPADVEGYTLESSASLASGWTPVSGVSGNSHPVPSTAAHAFFRLRR